LYYLRFFFAYLGLSNVLLTFFFSLPGITKRIAYVFLACLGLPNVLLTFFFSLLGITGNITHDILATEGTENTEKGQACLATTDTDHRSQALLFSSPFTFLTSHFTALPPELPDRTIKFSA